MSSCDSLDRVSVACIVGTRVVVGAWAPPGLVYLWSGRGIQFVFNCFWFNLSRVDPGSVAFFS